MSDIHALEILVIALACCVATLIGLVINYRRLFIHSKDRLYLLTNFMQYMESEKCRLPADVQFNYDACWLKSLALLVKQAGKKNGKV